MLNLGPKGLNATTHVTCLTEVLCCEAEHWNAPCDRTSIMNIAIHPGRKNHMSRGCQCSHIFDKPCEIHSVTTTEATRVCSTKCGSRARVFLHALPTSCVNVSAPPWVQCVFVRETFDTKETVEMAIRELFRQQNRATCCDINCKFKPKWQKIVNISGIMVINKEIQREQMSCI